MKILTVFSRFTGKLFFRLRYQKLKHDNLYFLKKQNTENYKNIVFYFPNEKYMHYGDHLFFEPIVSLLSCKSDFTIFIAPIKGIYSYFKSLSIQILDEVNSLDISNTLIISKPEFYNELKNKGFNVLYIDTTFYQSSLPICNDIASKISSFLHVDLDVSKLSPSPYVPDSNIVLKEQKVILFSNYIDSGFFRITKKKNAKLISKAIELKNSGHTLVHIGTKTDKNNDRQEYPFIDIDLRGKTTIDDMFYLASLSNVLGAICYDSFIMHVMFIFEKRVFVMFRGRFLKKNQNYILQKTIPPFFVSQKQKIDLL